MSTDVAKAMARISSGLYVVTAAHDGARSAMIASWVSQVGRGDIYDPIYSSCLHQQRPVCHHGNTRWRAVCHDCQLGVAGIEERHGVEGV